MFDRFRKWPVSQELQDHGFPPEASYDDFGAKGYAEGVGDNVLVDRTDSLLVFLYRGVWRVLGTNGL